MEKGRFSPVEPVGDKFLAAREELRSKGFCGECIDDMKTCGDYKRNRIEMDVDQQTGKIYSQQEVRGNIKNCVVFQAAASKLN